jgi:hypothetical protein
MTQTPSLSSEFVPSYFFSSGDENNHDTGRMMKDGDPGKQSSIPQGVDHFKKNVKKSIEPDYSTMISAFSINTL